jgi:hypothetical protein
MTFYLDPDPYQNVPDPQHCEESLYSIFSTLRKQLLQKDGSKTYMVNAKIFFS